VAFARRIDERAHDARALVLLGMPEDAEQEAGGAILDSSTHRRSCGAS
jgi:hypothetical protein